MEVVFWRLSDMLVDYWEVVYSSSLFFSHFFSKHDVISFYFFEFVFHFIPHFVVSLFSGWLLSIRRWFSEGCLKVTHPLIFNMCLFSNLLLSFDEYCMNGPNIYCIFLQRLKASHSQTKILVKFALKASSLSFYSLTDSPLF